MKTKSHIKTTAFTVAFCIGVCSLLSITGCNKQDEETVARIDALETRLNHVEELLEQAQTQRGVLTEKLEDLFTSLKENTSTIQSVQQSGEQLAAVTSELAEASTQRDAAMTETKEVRMEIQQLRGQLEQQAESTVTLQSQIAALQEMMAPPEVESVVSTEVEQAQDKKPIVGFPEVPSFEDPSVVVIRGRSRN